MVEHRICLDVCGSEQCIKAHISAITRLEVLQMPKRQSPPPFSGTNRARSIPEAAEVLNLSVRTVWQGIADGRIRSVKVSQRRRIITDAEIARILSGGVEEAAR
jgi:excisionase family DNA binding protein